MLQTVIVVVHLLVALGVIALVLLQQGKGAEAGASFGAGASGTVFGSQGSTTFLSRMTAVLVAIFFATSLGLGYYAKSQANEISKLGLPDPALLEVPVQNVVPELPALEEASKPATEDVPSVPQE